MIMNYYQYKADNTVSKEKSTRFISIFSHILLIENLVNSGLVWILHTHTQLIIRARKIIKTYSRSIVFQCAAFLCPFRNALLSLFFKVFRDHHLRLLFDK